MQKKHLIRCSAISDKKKTLSKVGVEGAYLNIIKAIYMRNLQPTSYSMDKN